MANLTLEGTVLGVQSKPYDFNDKETGERRVGTAHRLWLWDERGVEPIEVRLNEAHLPTAQNFAHGEVITCAVNVYTNNNRATFTFAGLLATA